jgi:two-component system KDP operon response regulator KdpE
MSADRVLVVDDEPQIQRFLRPALAAAGYEVIEAASGAEALKAASTRAPDVIILDLGLPDMDGKDVVARLRGWSDVPVIILSARDRESEKIEALDRGADDYVEKPFGIGELTARIRAALRRKLREEAGADSVSVDGLEIDMLRHTVARDGAAVHLTPKEYDLLALLARHAGRVMTHRALLTSVWGPAHADDLHYLRVFIGQLRQKIERDPTRPRLVRTEPGVGYRFIESEDREEGDGARGGTAR